MDLGPFLNRDFLQNFLKATLEMATPLIFAAMGEVYAERAGVLNLGLEGMMLVGAFAGFYGTYVTDSLWVGLLAAILAGALLGLLKAFMSVTLKVNQVISGVSIVILGGGLSAFFFRLLTSGLDVAPANVRFPVVEIPVLSQIPILGPVLFTQNVMVYLALVMAPILWVVLFRTTVGLNIRAVGDNPRAADSLGVNVFGVRYACVIFSGIMAGLGGAFLSMARMNTFQYYMTGGRGWIANAVVIFGRWNPLGVVAGALFFGGSDALQLRLQALGAKVPPQFLLMLPYVLTLVALLSISRKVVRPSALSTPYSREEE